MSIEYEIITSPETRPKQGVSAIIMDPRGLIYTVEETVSNPEYGKCRGMRTIPMETIESGESHEEAVERLIREELGENIFRVDSVERIGIYGLNIAAATLFVVRGDLEKPQDVNKIDGVINPRWITKEELLSSWTRAGVYEMINDCFSDQRNITRYYCNPVPIADA